jgi:acyl-CoA synthetase (AMP-forming)/AMP-acid ligase II
MALGYVNMKMNEEAYDAEGFFRLGDLGRVIDRYHILITGRIKDIIIRAGENISAKEIEDVLAESDRIREVAVVAMPSPKTGEAACAFVVPEDGEKITLAEIAEMVRTAGLARQKTPEHVEILSELPKTAAGKVLKHVLRDRMKGKVPAGQS